jgi:hypothetical protein
MTTFAIYRNAIKRLDYYYRGSARAAAECAAAHSDGRDSDWTYYGDAYASINQRTSDLILEYTNLFGYTTAERLRDIARKRAESKGNPNK